MSVFYENTYCIDSRDIDPHSHCRPSALLGYLQESATVAARQLGFARETVVEKYGVFWMITRMWYQLERPLFWNEQLTVRTSHRGGKGVAMYRDFDLFVGDELVGQAVSTWVAASLAERKLFPLSRLGEMKGTDGGPLSKTMKLHNLTLPEDMPSVEERSMRYSEADINGHINNVRYADYLCDALHLERALEGRFVSQVQMCYLKECKPGETLVLSAAQVGEEGYVHGTDQDGISRFSGKLTLSPWK